MKKIIWRPVSGVEVGNRIAVLIEALIIVVETEIDVEAPIVIVVSDGCVGEGSLRCTCKLESIPLQREAPVSLVRIQQRPGCADHEQILQPAVLKIGKQRARGKIQHANAGLFRHIFEGAISTIAIEAVG